MPYLRDRRVVMIHQGQIVFDGTPDELRAQGNDNLDEAFYKLTGAA